MVLSFCFGGEMSSTANQLSLVVLYLSVVKSLTGEGANQNQNQNNEMFRN
jgi:hypothetical protein